MDRRDIQFGRRKADHTWYTYLVKLAPRHIKVGLVIAAVVWSWLGFKSIEPSIFPVVTDFTIHETQIQGSDQLIAGMMIKRRDCLFKSVVAYSDNHLVGIRFTETLEPVSRIEGAQAWGVWIITPPVTELALYSRHECATGLVTTKLWEGEL